MTLEEKAEEYAKRTKKVDWEGFPIDKQARKEGYIAGATENGIIWHNLRKNPKDLPKNSDYEKLYLVYWGENNYGVAQFNDSRWWSFDSGLFNVEEVIAWCELLEFIECRI